jgi:cellulose synthase/poly-beta-1,6-N-acetylglucosamine synthase-like glycosyltransferase
MGDVALACAFWLSVSALFYAYVGYPVLIGWAGRKAASRPAPSGQRPITSFIVAAYNEEKVIAEKARNVLGQLEGGDEMIVVSDGSTDRTDAKVATVHDARLRLLRQEPRRGKNAALNLGVRESRGEVVAFSDANALLAPGSLGTLLAPFADPSVGLVSGQGLYGEVGPSDVRIVASAYVRYQAAIRQGEGALGFLSGVDGALYAMRRELFTELPLDQVHDLVHPIQVALAGRRCVFAPEAVTVEPPSRDAAAERRRQVRIIAQGFRVLPTVVPRLLAARRFREVWMLASHRILRWISWALLLIAVTTNVLLCDAHPLYRTLLACQAAFFTLAAAGAVAENLSVRLRLLALPYYFCLVSYAGFAGLAECLRGHAHTVWAKQGTAG